MCARGDRYRRKADGSVWEVVALIKEVPNRIVLVRVDDETQRDDPTVSALNSHAIYIPI